MIICYFHRWELGQKKGTLVSGNRPEVEFKWEYIFFVSKKTHTNKKVSTSKFIGTNLRFFSLETTKGRALCFSTKESAVRVVFKCKLYL